MSGIHLLLTLLLMLSIGPIIIQATLMLKNFSILAKTIIIVFNGVFSVAGTYTMLNISLAYIIDRASASSGFLSGFHTFGHVVGVAITAIICFIVKATSNNVLLLHLDKMKQKKARMIKYILIISIYLTVITSIEFFFVVFPSKN